MKQILSLNRASVRSYNCLFVELRVLHNSNWHQSEDILSPAQSQTSWKVRHLAKAIVPMDPSDLLIHKRNTQKLKFLPLTRICFPQNQHDVPITLGHLFAHLPLHMALVDRWIPYLQDFDMSFPLSAEDSGDGSDDDNDNDVLDAAAQNERR